VHGRTALTAVQGVLTIEEILSMRSEIEKIAGRASDTVLGYIVDLTRGTRPEDDKFNEVHDKPHAEEARILATRNEQPLTNEMLRNIIMLGASPRCEIWTLHCAAAHAFIQGKDNIDPDDVKAVFRDVARGRILINPVFEQDGYNADKVIDAVLARVPVIR